MIALIDIGNSRSKYSLLDNGCRGDIKTVVNEDFDGDYFEKKFKCVDKVVVASVSDDSLTVSIEKWCYQNKIQYKQVNSEQQKKSVISAYNKPEQLGVDRWLALIAVAQLYPNKNILIVDAGTATTIDLISASGKHQGGWILAGIDTLFTSVLQKTSKVIAEPAPMPSIAFGSNTSENVNNACWAATIGAIDVAITQASQELGSVDEVIITGGNAAALNKILIVKAILVEDLIFYGLEAYC